MINRLHCMHCHGTLTKSLFTERTSETIWALTLRHTKLRDIACAVSSIETRTDVYNERMEHKNTMHTCIYLQINCLDYHHAFLYYACLYTSNMFNGCLTTIADIWMSAQCLIRLMFSVCQTCTLS